MTSDLKDGDLAYDRSRDAVGRVVGRAFAEICLRPAGEGDDWSADPEQVRPATPAEEVAWKNRENNRNRYWRLRP